MLRRSPRSATALDQTKQELARQESELRDQMEKLERMIAPAPRFASEGAPRRPHNLSPPDHHAFDSGHLVAQSSPFLIYGQSIRSRCRIRLKARAPYVRA